MRFYLRFYLKVGLHGDRLYRVYRVFRVYRAYRVSRLLEPCQAWTALLSDVFFSEFMSHAESFHYAPP